jgi:hypothetical protein
MVKIFGWTAFGASVATILTTALAIYPRTPNASTAGTANVAEPPSIISNTEVALPPNGGSNAVGQEVGKTDTAPEAQSNSAPIDTRKVVSPSPQTPPPKPASAQTPIADPSPAMTPTAFDVRGMHIELEGCQNANAPTTCTLLATSTTRTKWWFSPSNYLTDGNGPPIKAVQMTVAGETRSLQDEHLIGDGAYLDAGVSTRITLTFDQKIDPQANYSLIVTWRWINPYAKFNPIVWK